MCGVAGYTGPDPLGADRVDACLRLMRHRGPDHAASRNWTTASGRHVSLLHTRLSIIDLDERAHQPFQVGSKWLAQNGELYNYVELRSSLARRGVAFRTDSDTEVMLQAVAAWGWPALDVCEGMWAFALYDEGDETLVLCRDRFGEKPMYLFRVRDGLYFGSEVKFIAALLGRRLDIDFDQVCRYLVNGYKALYKEQHTFFTGLTELEPGTLLHIDADGAERTRRYWQPRHAPADEMTYADAVAGARERLIDSVRLRLRADVPLAFCMSGGVDSNALIGIATNVLQFDAHGFTIVNTDARYEEQDLVARAVEAFGLRHTNVPIDTSGFLEKLCRLVRHHDAPVYTITYFAHWLLMEAIAANGYRVAISGTGADELFSGYYDHHLAYLYEVKDRPEHAPALAGWQAHVRPLVRNPHLGDPALFVSAPGFRDHIFLNADVFAACLTSPWSQPFSEGCFTPDLLRNRMLNELFHESVPVILHEDDLNAMFFSVENRSPYLDRRLFDFTATIPTRHLMGDGYAKRILRDAVRGVVPDCILDSRRKVGFNAPIFSFLAVDDPDVRAALLDESPIFDYVRRDRIEPLLDRSMLPNSESKFLFSFLSSKMFVEEFS